MIMRIKDRTSPEEFSSRSTKSFDRDASGDDYGTRASTAVIFDARDNVIRFIEQNYLAGGGRADRTERCLPLDPTQ